jgi:hypothetical protein
MSQSHIATDDQSVCLVTVLSIWGALSDERSGLSFVSQSAALVHCLYVQLFTCCRNANCRYNIYKASVSPGSVQQTNCKPYFL